MKLLFAYSIFFVLVFSCNDQVEESEKTLEFDVVTNCDSYTVDSIYQEKLDIHKFVCFLLKNRDEPIGVDRTKIPKDWIQKDQLPLLIYYVNDTRPCGQVTDILEATILKESYSSTVRQEILRLMKCFLNGGASIFTYYKI